MRKLLLILLPALLLSGCAGYVNSLYGQLDREEARMDKRRPTNSKGDKFAFYRQKGRDTQEEAPRLTTTERRVVDPTIKRQYVPSTEAKKRYKAEDLQDNSESGSLWAGEGRDNSLFASKHEKQNGDIVVINVMANLKNEITAELKKAYPSDTPAAKPAAAAPGEKAAPAPAEKPAAAPADDVATDQGQVYDKISSVIIEEINRDHILLRGRKTLMYNNRKVTVEVQALAPRKSLTEDDSIDSNNILESNIRVVR